MARERRAWQVPHNRRGARRPVPKPKEGQPRVPTGQLRPVPRAGGAQPPRPWQGQGCRWGSGGRRDSGRHLRPRGRASRCRGRSGLPRAAGRCACSGTPGIFSRGRRRSAASRRRHSRARCSWPRRAPEKISCSRLPGPCDPPSRTAYGKTCRSAAAWHAAGLRGPPKTGLPGRPRTRPPRTSARRPGSVYRRRLARAASWRGPCSAPAIPTACCTQGAPPPGGRGRAGRVGRKLARAVRRGGRPRGRRAGGDYRRQDRGDDGRRGGAPVVEHAQVLREGALRTLAAPRHV